MKRIISSIIKWFKESNRYKHLIYGGLSFIPIYTFFYIIPITDLVSMSSMASIIALLGVSTLAIGMEFKDKLWGGKFDFYDLISTIIIPTIVTIISLVIT